MDELEGGGFLELLSSGDADEAGFLLGCEPPCLSSACSATGCHMLCFGAGAAAPPPPQVSSESSLSSLSSSPPTSTTTSTVTTNSSKASKKVGVSGGLTDISSKKKARTGPSASQPGTMRVRKEKLGERIVALQQLVSPFGKSDTASVLHEALGYIRFLHDQVQVLSSPYLQRLPTPAHLHDGGGDLRSRGLCLVPVSCTEHVAKSNGADIWSPSSMGSSSNSSASKH